MKVLVKPIQVEENLLAEGYCELGTCKPVCNSACYLSGCNPYGSVNDELNDDDEILF